MDIASLHPERLSQWLNDQPVLTRMTISRLATEAVSVGVSIGAMYVLDNEVQCKPVKQMLANVIKPFIGAGDWVADHLPACESDEETHSRRSKDNDDRAYHYADVLFDNSARFVLSIATQRIFMEYFDEKMGVVMPEGADHAYDASIVWDRAVQYGGGFLMNTAFSKQNEQVQDTLQSMMEKWGMEKEHANIFARDMIIFHLPNVAGALASIASLYHSHGKSLS
jgi:hypothetical protein